MAIPEHRSPSELKALLEQERLQLPFLLFRPAGEGERILELGDSTARLTVGRSEANDVVLGWDDEVSRTHAALERIGDEWTVIDDGISQNGTFLNGERVAGRRRLGDGDRLRFGQTTLLFRDPEEGGAPGPTSPSRDPHAAPPLSETQRRVLIALCRPFKHGAGFSPPATNQQIATELHLSVPAVKNHLRLLFEKFGLERVAQNEKRLRLAQRALDDGAISPREL